VKRIPALVVGGFLGSGKTTLVRRLLDDARASGVRAAVVSNEFGELGIDAALIGAEEPAFVEIEGGCVCCRLSDELVETLQMLWERVQPDRVIVEISGVALPFDTQRNLWRDPVAQWVEDDVAVVVVNADQLASGEGLYETFEQQVSSADLLLLNKIDLVPEASLPALEARLRELEPDAPILRAVHAQVDPGLLFPPDPAGLRAQRRAAAEAPPPHSHEQYRTEEIAVETGIDPDALVQRFAQSGALRAKGFVHTSAGVRLLQGVGSRIELKQVEGDAPKDLVGRVVVVRRA